MCPPWSSERLSPLPSQFQTRRCSCFLLIQSWANTVIKGLKAEYRIVQMDTGSLLWFTPQILKIKWKLRDGTETVADYVEAGELHQEIEFRWSVSIFTDKNKSQTSKGILCLVYYFLSITVNAVQDLWTLSCKEEGQAQFPTQTTLLTHLQDKNKLLPASYTPHASFCLQHVFFYLFNFYFQLITRKSFYFHILLAAGILQMREAGLRCIYLIPQQKIPATYGAVMTPSFRWRGKQASGLGSFVTLHLLD